MHIDSNEPKSRMRSLLEMSGILAQLVTLEPSTIETEYVHKVHLPSYVEQIEKLSSSTGGDAGDGTPFLPGAYDVALLAAGGLSAAADAVLLGTSENAYALVRPSGHHAERDRGRGFCIFNNIAIGIERMRSIHSVDRVAVVDWDVHHGNGTQSIFWNDRNVLTISVHQDSLFPVNTGHRDERGSSSAPNSCINIPLPPGSGIGAYREAFLRIILPAVREFGPDIILIACGFDASFKDPLGRMILTSRDFREMTSLVCELAAETCDGRLVMCQEGGYSPYYVPFCGLAVVEELCGCRSQVLDPYIAADLSDPYDAIQAHQKNLILSLEADWRLASSTKL
jgi:acetoin utilization deacetylase AcuC-like enzyme